MAYTHATAINKFGVTPLIVATSAANGSHTTLASAMADAVSGDTIFLRDSVSENVTITPGVNITAWSGGSLNVPTITGTLTMTGAGTSTISGLRLTTNSAVVIAVTGTAASILNVNNCYLNLSNNTGITYSSSDATSQINIFNCTCNTATTGITYFSDSSSGVLSIVQSEFINSGGSSTTNTKSAGQILIKSCTFRLPLTYSSSSTASSLQQCVFNTAGTNSTFLTTSGTGTMTVAQSQINCGSASCFSVGSGTVAAANQCIFNSSNTNCITGAGTLNYSDLSFTGTSFLINVTTQNGGLLKGGQFQAPPAGFIGEQIVSVIGSGAPVSLLNNTATNITSISLTPGVWDISCLLVVNANGATWTRFQGSINTTSATTGTSGDNLCDGPIPLNAIRDSAISIPAWRRVFTATTTVYLVAVATVTVANGSGYGRLSATRVG